MQQISKLTIHVHLGKGERVFHSLAKAYINEPLNHDVWLNAQEKSAPSFNMTRLVRGLYEANA